MRFSVVIPVYNNKEWLPKCFDSVLNQTFTDYEVILVNDMSTDGNEKIIKEYKSKFKEKCRGIKIINNKTKRLNGGTRNVGIAEATGEYIVFIDCDDWFKNNKVFEEINKALVDEDLLFIGYEFHAENMDKPNILKYEKISEAIMDVTCAPWTKVVKTSILKETPFPEGTLFEDRIFHYRLLMKIKSFKCLEKALYVWNRTNIQTICNRSDYVFYRFNYCGELYRLIKDIGEHEQKEFLKNELKGYLKSCNEMVEKL